MPAAEAVDESCISFNGSSDPLLGPSLDSSPSISADEL